MVSGMGQALGQQSDQQSGQCSGERSAEWSGALPGQRSGIGMSLRDPRRQGGFTLVELLVVMAIVALLLTIAAPRYFGSLDKSKDVALAENLKVLRITLDRFYADKGRYPDTLTELVDQKYLRQVPTDPVTGSDTSWVLVPPKDGAQGAIADVKSGATGSSRDGRGYETF